MAHTAGIALSRITNDAQMGRPDYDDLMRRAIAACILLAACAGPRPPWRSSPLVGKSVEISAPDLSGRTIKVGDDQGMVRIVDFFATWCEPCREQFLFLDRLARDHGSKGLSVFGVAFDEDRAALEAFCAAMDVSFPVMWDKGGGALAERLDVTRLPTTLVVDRKGVVRFVHLGFERAEEPRIEGEVAQLLAE
jgi:thiol-disulfide isomerase/thioredoxin